MAIGTAGSGEFAQDQAAHGNIGVLGGGLPPARGGLARLNQAMQVLFVDDFLILELAQHWIARLLQPIRYRYGNRREDQRRACGNRGPCRRARRKPGGLIGGSHG